MNMKEIEETTSTETVSTNEKGSYRLKGKNAVYLWIPVLLNVALLGLAGWVYTSDKKLGIIIAVVGLDLFLLDLILCLLIRRRYLRDMVEFSQGFAQVQKKLLKNSELPYGLLDSAGIVLSMNQSLADILPGAVGKHIISEIPTFRVDDLKMGESEEKTFYLDYEEHHYRVLLHRIVFDEKTFQADISGEEELEDGKQYLIAMNLFDETEIYNLSKEIVAQKMVVAFVYIDNYEDVLENITDARQSLIMALVERCINQYFGGYNGVVKRLEKDRFMVFFKQKYLSMMQSNKFSVLDEVKNVKLGNEKDVTISIGLGLNAKELPRCCEFAQKALNSALARGGDQAVVKDGEKMYYYGGKSKSVEKNTRVKARVKAQALREILETKEKIVVMGHKTGDIDSFASALGIAIAAKAIAKKAYVVINTVTSSFRPMMERIREDQTTMEYVEFIDSDRAMEIVDDMTAVVVVDVNRPANVECPEILAQTKTVVVLDHHRQSSESIESATLSYIEPYASSASEMVTEILQYFGDGVKIRSIEADALYEGIVIDTSNFIKNTSARTFEAVAYLKKCGADVGRLREMFKENLDTYRARAATIQSAVIFREGMAMAVCPPEGLDSPTIVGAQAANELLNITGIQACFVLTEYNNKIYVSARSTGKINVQIIMEKIGGGGHLDTAGAQFADLSIEEAKKTIEETVEEMVNAEEL